jgi:hypothetical protein
MTRLNRGNWELTQKVQLIKSHTKKEHLLEILFCDKSNVYFVNHFSTNLLLMMQSALQAPSS